MNNANSFSVIVISDFMMTDSNMLNKFEKMLEGAHKKMNILAFVFIGQFYDMKSLSSE